MTDWEDQYRRGETPWDKGAPAPPLVDFLARASLHGDILVPGCGLGHDVRALASQPMPPGETRVLGVDVSSAAIRAAEAVPPAGEESYRVGDLFALPAEIVGAFDWVVEHTCFCAIDPARRSDYVRAVHAALRPGGRLLAIFYLNPHDPGEDRTGPPFESNVAELDELFSPWFTRLEEYRPARSYPGREGRELVRLLEKKVL